MAGATRVTTSTPITIRRLVVVATLLVIVMASGDRLRAQQQEPIDLFQTADRCFACHNGLSTPTGEDISIGTSWRPTMMANSARDPYWQAGVRREVSDHPESQKAIEDECAVCHMPMARRQTRHEGGEAEVFAHSSRRAATR
jgi:hypothetical protein